MNYSIIFKTLFLSFSLFGMVSQSHAASTAGVDSYHKNSRIVIKSNNLKKPTVIGQVRVKCPKKGFLVAFANFEWLLRAPKGKFGAAIAYSISRNTLKSDENHQHVLVQSFFSEKQAILVPPVPGSLQRSDSCKAGASYVYRFTAFRWGKGAAKDSFAWQPNLIVQYFPKKI